MTDEILRCSKCGWMGKKGKFTTCSSCNTPYYQCSFCGGKMEIIPTIT